MSALSLLKNLQKGAGAADAQQENDVNDPPGTIRKFLEKRTVTRSHLYDDLGMLLSEKDAVVDEIKAGSPADAKKVPRKYAIIEVNGVPCDNKKDVETEVRKKAIGLNIKLLSMAGVEELFTKFVALEPTLPTNVPSDEQLLSEFAFPVPDLPFDDYKNNPKYAFLGAQHPLYSRWKRRYESAKSAKRAEMVLALSLRRKEEEDAARLLIDMEKDNDENEETVKSKTIRDDNNDESILPLPVTSASILGSNNRVDDDNFIGDDTFETFNVSDKRGGGLLVDEDDAGEHMTADNCEDLVALVLGGKQKEEGGDTTIDRNDELLRHILGYEDDARGLLPTPPADEDAAFPQDPNLKMELEKERITYRTLPEKAYTLSDGKEVTIRIKIRNVEGGSGSADDEKIMKRIPSPPPGPIPRLSNQEKKARILRKIEVREKLYGIDLGSFRPSDRRMRGRESEYKKNDRGAKQQICHDFQVGRCHRKLCQFAHIPDNRARRRNRSPYEKNTRMRTDTRRRSPRYNRYNDPPSSRRQDDGGRKHSRRGVRSRTPPRRRTEDRGHAGNTRGDNTMASTAGPLGARDRRDTKDVSMWSSNDRRL